MAFDEIRTTENHKFYARKKDGNKFQEPMWIECKDLTSDYYLGVIGTWKNLSSDPQQLFRTMDVSLEYNDKNYNGELIYYNLFGATEISPDLSEQFELVFPLTEEMYENKGEFNIICYLHELDERGSEVYKDGSMDFKLVDTVILNIK